VSYLLLQLKNSLVNVNLFFFKNLLVRYFKWILKYSNKQSLLKCYYEINQIFGDTFSLLLPLEEHQQDIRLNSQQKLKFRIKTIIKPFSVQKSQIKIEDVFEVPVNIKRKKLSIKI
jgi:hypothetical protein